MIKLLLVMKEKKKLNQNTFLLLVTILLFFVMYAIGCVLFNVMNNAGLPVAVIFLLTMVQKVMSDRKERSDA